MNAENPVDTADRISRKRARMWTAFAIIWVSAQAAFAPWYHGHALAQVRPWLWVALCLGVLGNLATGGGLLLSRKVRELVNDEVSAVHRLRALAAGFWAAMALGLGLFILSHFDTVTGAEAAYIIVTFPLAIALVVFAAQERRAHRDA